MRCPACKTALEPCDVNGVAFRMCPDCDGALVEVPRLVPLLQELAEPLASSVHPSAHIDRHPDPDVRRTCPGCATTMTPFGYLGTNLVTLDRCGDCLLIWADPGELAAATRLYTRTDKRVKSEYQKHKEWRQGMSAMDQLVARAEANRIARRLS